MVQTRQKKYADSVLLRRSGTRIGFVLFFGCDLCLVGKKMLIDLKIRENVLGWILMVDVGCFRFKLERKNI